MNRYLIQTKPRIILLLTFTGVIGYFIPSLSNVNFINLILFVIFGVLSAAGALTINNVIDRDIDALMIRTSSRPSLGEDAIPARNLMIFGISLSLIGIIGGFIKFGLFTAFHLAWGNLFYLFGYTLYLKRKSILNTILGGLASPAPVWAAFAARYDLGSITTTYTFLGVTPEGWFLGLLVFIWTPSHTWAMATKNFEDYKNADIPMLPVKVGLPATTIYTAIGGIITIIYGTWLAVWISGENLISLALIIPNAIFIYGLWQFYDDPSPDTGNICFKIHNFWLTIIFSIILLFHWT